MAKMARFHPFHAHHEVHERRRSVLLPALFVGGLVAVFGLAFMIRRPVQTSGADIPASIPVEQPHPQNAAAAGADEAQARLYLSPDILAVCQISQPSAYFATGSSTISDPDRGSLDKFVSCLRSGALVGRQIRVIGYTDARGSAGDNATLGQQRAESVSAYLRESGVPGDRILPGSAGEQQAGATSPEGMATERRVDVQLIP